MRSTTMAPVLRFTTALRISVSLGFGLRFSRSCACITMPFMQ